jgi:DNA-binding MarR family transcriptional regulator
MLSTQVLSPESTELETWVQWLRAHAAVTRELNAQLVNEHGLTINDYEVLLHLAKAPKETLKPVELAARVLLTPSGITRLLAGLERSGYVCRVDCAADKRVSYAQLTPEGREKLREASDTHLAGIAAQFTGRFTRTELATLAELIARLPGGERTAATDCTVD